MAQNDILNWRPGLTARALKFNIAQRCSDNSL